MASARPELSLDVKLQLPGMLFETVFRALFILHVKDFVG